MKAVIFFSLMVLTIGGLAQNNETPLLNSVEDKLLIGINFSPDLCYRSLINNEGSTTSADVIKLQNKYESIKFSYTTGVNLKYKILKCFGIELGAQYSDKGYQSKTSGIDNLTFADQLNDRNGLQYTSGTVLYMLEKTIDHFNYLDIPIKFSCETGNKKLGFTTGIGITTNILLSTSRTFVYYDNKHETKKHYSTFNKLNFSPLLSMGLVYRVTNKLRLYAEPTFRYGILPIIDSPVSAHLWNCGFNIACYYNLK